MLRRVCERKPKEQGIELIEEPTPGGEAEASFSGDLDFLNRRECYAS
jgi:hypothetical protein